MTLILFDFFGTTRRTRIQQYKVISQITHTKTVVNTRHTHIVTVLKPTRKVLDRDPRDVHTRSSLLYYLSLIFF